MADADAFRPQDVLLEPGGVVEVLHPDQTAAGPLGVVVYQQVLIAVTGKISDHHALQPVRGKNRVRIPLHAGFARVLIPIDALFQHPTGTDHIHAAITVDVHRGLVIIIYIRPIGLRAVAIVRVLSPFWRQIVIPAGGDVEFAIAVNIKHGSRFRKRPEPVSVLGWVVYRAIDLHRDEYQLPGRLVRHIGKRRRIGTVGRGGTDRETTDARNNRAH